MQNLKKILTKNFSTFHFFYSFLGYRIFLALCLSMFVSVLDGFLSMFLPLFQMVGGNEEVDSESMGSLRFLLDGIQNLGIELNLVSILVFMLLFFVFKGGVAFLGGAYNVFLQQRFIKQVRLNLLSALNNIKFNIFMTSDAGRIQNTMSGEVEKISVGYNFYRTAFQQGVVVAVCMSFVFFADFQFALLVAVGGGALTNILYSTL